MAPLLRQLIEGQKKWDIQYMMMSLIPSVIKPPSGKKVELIDSLMAHIDKVPSENYTQESYQFGANISRMDEG